MKKGGVDHISVKTDARSEDVAADYYLFAVLVEMMRRLLTPQMIAAALELCGIRAMKTSWMTGLVYYFSEAVKLNEGHIIYADSPWALTSISELPFWTHVNGSNIGAGNVGSVFSTIISNWNLVRRLGRSRARAFARPNRAAERRGRPATTAR